MHIECGKSITQIQNETAENYINKTVTVVETAEQTEARKEQFSMEWPRNFLISPWRSVAGCSLRWTLVERVLQLPPLTEWVNAIQKYTLVDNILF